MTKFLKFFNIAVQKTVKTFSRRKTQLSSSAIVFLLLIDTHFQHSSAVVKIAFLLQNQVITLNF